EAPVPWVTQKLSGRPGPVVAVSDYMRAVQDQIRQCVPGDSASLGADGFGFSDTRPAARRFFHIDGPSMAVRALQSLAEGGEVDRSVPLEAARRYRLSDVTAGSSGNEGGDSCPSPPSTVENTPPGLRAARRVLYSRPHDRRLQH